MKPGRSVQTHVPVCLVQIVNDGPAYGDHARADRHIGASCLSQVFKIISQGLAGIATVILIVTLIPGDCWASMVFIAANKTQVVVAADSRRSVSGIVDERACKIKLGTRSIFVITGSFPPGWLDLFWATGEQLANDELGTATDHLNTMISIFSNVKILEPSQQEHRGAMAFIEMTENGPLVAGAYFTMEGTQIVFRLKTDGDWWRVHDFGAGYYILFDQKVAATEAAVVSSLKAGSALPDLMALATWVIESQARVDPSVGGPIDIATIDRIGPRWQRCKAECGHDCPR